MKATRACTACGLALQRRCSDEVSWRRFWADTCVLPTFRMVWLPYLRITVTQSVGGRGSARTAARSHAWSRGYQRHAAAPQARPRWRSPASLPPACSSVPIFHKSRHLGVQSPKSAKCRGYAGSRPGARPRAPPAAGEHPRGHRRPPETRGRRPAARTGNCGRWNRGRQEVRRHALWATTG